LPGETAGATSCPDIMELKFECPTCGQHISATHLLPLWSTLSCPAFILSIIAMAQRRLAAGITLLIVALAVAPLTWLGLVVFKVGSSIAGTHQT